MKKLTITLLLTCFSLAVLGQDSLKVMFYNVYRFPVNIPANREIILREIIDYTRPDLLMACEIVNEAGAELILDSSFTTLSTPYRRADFHYCQTTIDDPLQQMVYFNAHKLLLIGQHIYPTTVRDINHYQFLLNTINKETDSIRLDVFVAHLKSSEGPANRALRKGMVDTFAVALETLPPDRHVIFAGDFNFYQSENETGFQKIIDTTNAILMFDPLQSTGIWHDKPEFAAVHTQSTRTSLTGFGLGGAAGGLDDRFDFIMLSRSLQSDADLYFESGSYQVVGNNGNCFNERVDNNSCFGPYSLQLRYYLHQMSDHLPVSLVLKTAHRFTGIKRTKKPKSAFELRGPNLVSRSLQLRIYSREVFRGGNYVIYDLPGRLLKTGVVPVGAKSLEVSIADLLPGMYFLRLDYKIFRFLKR